MPGTPARGLTAVVVLSVVLAGSGPVHGAASVQVAGPGAKTSGYLSPVIVAARAQAVVFTNADQLDFHDLVSWNPTGGSDGTGGKLYGPGSSPWCTRFPRNKCPLFTSRVIGPRDTDLIDLRNTIAGQTYEFACSLHLGAMKGALQVVA